MHHRSQMQINLNFIPKGWQKDALELLDSNPSGIIVIKSPRQRGKSFLLTAYSLKRCLENARFKCYFMSPSFKQCLKIFKEMKDVVSNAPFVRSINSSEYNITFTNSSFIQFISAEQDEDKLQGNTANLLIVDEGAYTPDNIFFTCLPYTNATNGQVLVCSTPRFQTGFFYNLFNDGKDPSISNVHSLDVNDYDTSDMISEERLAYYRKTLSRIMYQMHYLGEFVSADGSVFSEFGDCIGQATEADWQKEVHIGVDWASGVGGDSTVFTAINVDGVVLEIKAFSDKDGSETACELVRFAEKFNTKKILVEANSIGEVLYQLTKKYIKDSGRHLSIDKRTTTNENKLAMVEAL